MRVIPEIKLTKEDATDKIKECSKLDGLCYFKTVISPDIAKELLTLEKRNRRRRCGAVTNYARYMTTGKWTLNPAPIVFDIAGELSDGGHRLDAIVKANIPIDFIICCGLVKKSRDGIDQGNPRTVADVVCGDVTNPRDLNSEKYSAHAAVIRSMMVESVASLKITIPKLEAVDLLRNNLPTIDMVVRKFVGKKGCKFIKNASVLAPIARAYMNYSKNATKTKMIDRFVEILSGNAVNIAPDEMAAHKLRDWLLINMSKHSTRPVKRSVYRRTEMALWLYLQKQSCEYVTEATREHFPIEVGDAMTPYFDNTKILCKPHGYKRMVRKSLTKKPLKIKINSLA
jgi:hypothetical protein